MNNFFRIKEKGQVVSEKIQRSLISNQSTFFFFNYVISLQRTSGWMERCRHMCQVRARMTCLGNRRCRYFHYPLNTLAILISSWECDTYSWTALAMERAVDPVSLTLSKVTFGRSSSSLSLLLCLGDRPRGSICAGEKRHIYELKLACGKLTLSWTKTKHGRSLLCISRTWNSLEIPGISESDVFYVLSTRGLFSLVHLIYKTFISSQ